MVETVAGWLHLFSWRMMEHSASGSGVKFVAQTVSIHREGSSPVNKKITECQIFAEIYLHLLN